MDREAEALFRELLAQAGPTGGPRQRPGSTWRRLPWQRGEPGRAQAALRNISSTWRGPLAADADYLRAAISLRAGDLDEARVPGARRRTHLALALITTWGAALPAMATGRRRSRLPAPRPQPLGTGEGARCRTRPIPPPVSPRLPPANLPPPPGVYPGAAGRPLADRALLGYGWAQAEQEDYRAALSPWLLLAERDPAGTSVREPAGGTLRLRTARLARHGAAALPAGQRGLRRGLARLREPCHRQLQPGRAAGAAAD